MEKYYVYILSGRKNGTLYVGSTSDLMRRIHQHKNKVFDGFTKKCDVLNLVYYENHYSKEDALKREKRIKKWNRQWKIELLEKTNPE
ncbi:MAG: GIY-YIG nuclease family protein [Ignavibacteria bacterium]|nr:GIY-YIG nuclease family protein [Ignavibacteria bacterium]